MVFVEIGHFSWQIGGRSKLSEVGGQVALGPVEKVSSHENIFPLGSVISRLA